MKYRVITKHNNDEYLQKYVLQKKKGWFVRWKTLRSVYCCDHSAEQAKDIFEKDIAMIESIEGKK